MPYKILLFYILFPFYGISQSISVEIQVDSAHLKGTLSIPTNLKKMPVALIIAGSGPTDRDGNNQMMKNNSLKMLSDSLISRGIATLRFDKRGIGESIVNKFREDKLTVDTYINDAKHWLEFLKKEKKFTKIIVIGHSEGALIGMNIANQANKYISLAGAGFPADEILKTQLSKQAKGIKDYSYAVLDSLKQGKTVQKINPLLYSLFRPSVQPYLISWFKHDPRLDLQALKVPILLIQGSKDIQISMADVESLHQAMPTAEMIIIENMNHVLKIISGNDLNENIQSYKNPNLSISASLVEAITRFCFK